MPPIPLLTKLDLLQGVKTALDVGTKDGTIAIKLTNLKIKVDAIDTEPLPNAIAGITFEQISVEDFLLKNTKRYDVVIARHILPFTNDPLSLIKKLNNIADVFLFTCFGPQDDWAEADHVVTLEKDEIRHACAPATVRHYSETFEYTKTYVGEMKHWHYHTVVVDNR
jgi:hypothetical protein